MMKSKLGAHWGTPTGMLLAMGGAAASVAVAALITSHSENYEGAFGWWILASLFGIQLLLSIVTADIEDNEISTSTYGFASFVHLAGAVVLSFHAFTSLLGLLWLIVAVHLCRSGMGHLFHVLGRHQAQKEAQKQNSEAVKQRIVDLAEKTKAFNRENTLAADLVSHLSSIELPKDKE